MMNEIEGSGRSGSTSAKEVNGTLNEAAPTSGSTAAAAKSGANVVEELNNQRNLTLKTLATMGKNTENEPEDGAQEKMLKEDNNKATIVKDATEVKFISENGDTKINIGAVKQALSGMDKEELMKYANDPFWVRLRWSLFALFWLLWLGMLAGAVAIIVMAPKCSAPVPKTWYEESPIIHLEESSTPSLNLKGYETLLDKIKDQHIRAISLDSIVKESSPGHTIDFKDLKQNLGQMEDFKSFVEAAKQRDQKVVLELDPNHSSNDHPWFKRSVKREEPYSSYYVWADPKIGTDSRNNPPNNWLSVEGGSAWEWSQERGQYYLHQFKKSQPDLNYNNPLVVAELSNILSHWLNLGVAGFRLAHTSYLTEDQKLRDESKSNKPVDLENYDSLTHVFTRERPENREILKEWRRVVANATNGDGLLALQDDIGADILAVYNDKARTINLPQNSHFLAEASEAVTATELQANVTQLLRSGDSWPSWNLEGNNNRGLRKRTNGDVANSLTLLTLLLPGTPILTMEALELKEALPAVVSTRSQLAFQFGELKTYVLNNGTVFGYSMLKSGSPGYLVLYNAAADSTVVDASAIPHVAEEVSILAHSPNYSQEAALKKLPSKAVPMSKKSTVILTFVPKMD